MSTLTRSELTEPLTDYRQLIEYLARGARPRAEWGVGAETEKLVIDEQTGEAAGFDRIEQLLTEIARHGCWRSVYEDGRLLALIGEHSSITLEPGGQLELSGRLCRDIHCCAGDLATHLNEVVALAAAQGLQFLGLGCQPFTPLGQIAWLPKARYGIMGPYMARTGDMGQAMMKQTAGLQVNLDFADEEDCIDKLRLGLALAPLFYALFANSPVMEGRPTGFLSTRGEIWSRTDADRSGLIPSMFAEGANFASYVEYALDVPMYFIVREGRFIDLTTERFPFRRFLQQGHGVHRAQLADWDLHLSTLFPEARLRPQIEFRTADALPPRMTLSVAALLKGIFYDSDAQNAVWNLLRKQSMDERLSLYRQSWKKGLQAREGSVALVDVARETVAIAKASLRRQRQLNACGLDESLFLEELEEIATTGVTLAERLLAGWGLNQQQNLSLIKRHCAFG